MRLARSIGVLIAAAAACSVNYGCGSASSPVSGSSSATDAAPTKAQATAYARAVNLQPADLPGTSIVVDPEVEAPAETQVEREERRCAGVKARPGAAVANIYSAKVASGGTQFASAVEVLRSPIVATHNVAAERSQRGRACFQHFFPLALAANGPRVGTAKLNPLPFPLPRVRGYGQEVVVIEQGVPTSVGHLHLDSFGFASGPAEVNLTVTFLHQPPSKATETQLLSLLYGRAKAHKL